jgi:hypothetical protein
MAEIKIIVDRASYPCFLLPFPEILEIEGKGDEQWKKY